MNHKQKRASAVDDIELQAIRVFISSTFTDFVEERRLLASRVFPELRRRLRGRLVELIEIDLRWGITAEESERGEVLPICLAEIDKSRPFFIGLLGERYGWVPSPGHFSEALLESHPWLHEHQAGTSITELEIVHGVLANPEMGQRALFFFRSAAYAQGKAEGFRSATPSELERLTQLKERIRASRLTVVEDYPDPETMAAQLTELLWQRIDAEVPKHTSTAPHYREAIVHEAQRRGLLSGYTGREELEQSLSDAATRGSVCVTGVSGAGKSSVMAGWTARQTVVPSEDLHVSFAGASAESSAPSGIVRRAWQWIADRVTRPCAAASFQDGEDLTRAFALFLGGLDIDRPLIWVIDGINQLQNSRGDVDLTWLPDPLPPWLRLVVSCLDDDGLRGPLSSRGYFEVPIPPLVRSECQALIERHLAHHRRKIDSSTLQRLLSDTRLTNPFYLVTVLRELRRIASHHSIVETLDAILGGPEASPDKIVCSLLHRWDSEVAGWTHRPLCREVLSLLESSRSGLSEREIRDITGASSLDWSYLLGLLEEHLAFRGALLTIGHDLFREAIRETWLPALEEQRKSHRLLADYFASHLEGDRSLTMLLPQLAALEDHRAIVDRLCDIPWTARAIRVMGLSRVADFLRELPSALRPQAHLVGSIRLHAAAPSSSLSDALLVAQLLSEIHALDAGNDAFTLLTESARGRGETKVLRTALLRHGENEYRRAGDAGYTAAQPLLEESMAMCIADANTEPEELGAVALALGRLHLSRHRFREADAMLATAESALIEAAGPMDDRAIEAIRLRGISCYWRYLRGIGRWGHAESALLDEHRDLLGLAQEHWQRALTRIERGLGPTHPKTLDCLHYLQEAPYSTGRFGDALPWLRRLDELDPPADSTRRYACIIALREEADRTFRNGQLLQSEALLGEAERRAMRFSGEHSEPVRRIQRQRGRQQNGEPGLDDALAVPLTDLPPQRAHDSVRAVWSCISLPPSLCDDPIAHSWLTDPFSGDVFLVDRGTGALWRWHPRRGFALTGHLGSSCDGFVLPDWEHRRFFRWSHPGDSVFSAPIDGGDWTLLAEGRHDVHGGGPFGWNAVTNRPFQFGGYGYFTYKNWWREFDAGEGRWIFLDPNQPGKSPFPRAGQIAPGPSPESIFLFSGVGGETGIQREPAPRGGLPSANELGWFTWLRDLWELDLKTRQWTCRLAPNHASIRQEGVYGFQPVGHWHLLRGGYVPPTVFGETSPRVNLLQVWDGVDPEGFRPVSEEGDVPPYLDHGTWVPIPRSASMLWISRGELWTCSVTREPRI